MELLHPVLQVDLAAHLGRSTTRKSWEQVWRTVSAEGGGRERWSSERRKLLLLLSTTDRSIRGAVPSRSAAFPEAAVGSGGGRTVPTLVNYLPTLVGLGGLTPLWNLEVVLRRC